jgi:hypothetical protein
MVNSILCKGREISRKAETREDTKARSHKNLKKFLWLSVFVAKPFVMNYRLPSGIKSA